MAYELISKRLAKGFSYTTLYKMKARILRFIILSRYISWHTSTNILTKAHLFRAS